MRFQSVLSLTIIGVMKKIWQVYLSNIKHVFSNRVAFLIVLVLCILPSLYAWFYLKSSRDPYGNTKGLKIAVVNEDLGVVFRDQRVNIWADVVNELKTNDSIWWVFVDSQVAQEGTRLGKYYASIVIESWFSEKMVSLLDDFPRHPEIHYTVNEKINAIAPKITAKGASSIKENIQKSFLDSLNRVLMEKLNLVGFDLKNSKQSVYSLIDFVHDARTSLDHLDQKIDKMLELSYRSRFRLEEMYGKVPEVKTNINDVQSTLSKSSLLAQNSLNFLNTTPEKIKGYKSELQIIANDIDGEFSRILDKADQKNQNFAQDLQRINPKLSQLEQQVGNQAASLQQVRLLISGLFPGAPILTKLDAAIANLNTVSSKSSSLRGTLSSVQSEVQETIDFSRDTQKAITSLRDDMRTTLDEVHTNYQNDIEPLLTEVLKEIDTLSQQGTEKLDTLEKKLPQVEKNIDWGIEILNIEIEKIRSFQDKLPKLQSSVHVIDNQLQKLKKSWKVEELIQLATLNPTRFSDFVSEPVELVENKLFSIPNYGSAMSPFFTTLAIWVGSLLSISLFTTKTREKAFQNFKSYQKYLGKRLFFLTIALLQGIVVSLWDMWLLDAYVANPRAFFFASLRVALVFSMIVYTTVSTFWSAGKAIVIIFLVLQLSGAGGTFPIELSGTFFQSINPFLPFTYAIAAMREAVGGVVWEIYLPNLIILLGFFGVFLLLGLFLKPLIAGKVERFESKFSESELGEH